MSLFRRRRRDGSGDDAAGAGAIDALLVALGNPGSRYAATRHNVGFEIASLLSARWEMPRARERFRGRITEGRTRPGGPRVAILLPQTFMNESGTSAGPARGSLRVPLGRVIAIHDEIDLPFGRVRIKVAGGHGGHNGLRSLIEVMEAGFTRIRVGVGHPGSREQVVDHVLGGFSKEEQKRLADLIGLAADAAEVVLKEGPAVAMNRFHPPDSSA